MASDFMDFWFIFKKIVSIGLTPITITMEIVILGGILLGFSRRTSLEKPGPKWLWFKGISGDLGSYLVWLGIIFLYLCSIEPVAGNLSRLLEKQHPPLTEVPISPEYIVVLPGGHRFGEGKPADSQVQRKTFLRLSKGVEYWRQFPESTLVFSGLPYEVEPMRDIAVKMGVAEDKIFLETEARDTKDHPRYLKKLLTGKPFLLVTSGNHMPRSAALFEGQGLTPTPAATDFHYSEMPFFAAKLIPQERYLVATEEFFHEFLGMGWAAMRQQISEREEARISPGEQPAAGRAPEAALEP